MTVHDQTETVQTPTVPRPRTTEEVAGTDRPRNGTVGEFPWPEPWRHSRGARPRSEYWDAATASWHSRGPIPAPRSGE